MCTLLTLSSHVQEGYSSHFVVLSFCSSSVLEDGRFLALKMDINFK